MIAIEIFLCPLLLCHLIIFACVVSFPIFNIQNRSQSTAIQPSINAIHKPLKLHIQDLCSTKATLRPQKLSLHTIIEVKKLILGAGLHLRSKHQSHGYIWFPVTGWNIKQVDNYEQDPHA